MASTPGANLETGTNSAIFGAHAANYKTEVQSSTVLGVTAGYGGGTIKTSVLIGNSTADNNQSSDAKNIENSILIGNFAGRLMDITPAGAGNVLIGNLAGSLTTITGGFNTGVGRSFFSALTTGIQNTAIGDGAGATQATGNQNTSVGVNANPGGAVFANTTNVGYQAASTASNQVTLGNASVGTLRCQVTSITALSDARDKIIDGDGCLSFDSLEFMKCVKVRWFTWDTRDGAKKTYVPEAGVFAQELDELQVAYGIDLGLVDKTNPDRLDAPRQASVPAD